MLSKENCTYILLQCILPCINGRLCPSEKNIHIFPPFYLSFTLYPKPVQTDTLTYIVSAFLRNAYLYLKGTAKTTQLQIFLQKTP